MAHAWTFAKVSTNSVSYLFPGLLCWSDTTRWLLIIRSLYWCCNVMINNIYASQCFYEFMPSYNELTQCRVIVHMVSAVMRSRQVTELVFVCGQDDLSFGKHWCLASLPASVTGSWPWACGCTGWWVNCISVLICMHRGILGCVNNALATLLSTFG